MALTAISPTGVFSAFVTPTDSSAGTGIAGALGQIPSNTNAPIIFEPYWTLTDGIPEIWIIGSGDSTWGGAQVWMSLDGTTYAQVGTLVAGAAQGVLSATFASGSDPDTVNTLSVNLTESLGALIPGTSADADFELPTLAYCNGELIAFSAATLTSAYNYDLDTYIRRGCYNTAIGSHASGTQFAWIQTPAAFSYPVPLIGTTVYFKFPAFNTLGAQLQDLAGLTVYTYTLTGFGLRPLFSVLHETADFTITASESIAHFDNAGASIDIVGTLPAAADGLMFGFLVSAAFYLKVQASGSDIISRGNGDNSAAGGYIRSNLPYSFVVLEGRAGRWIVNTEVGSWGIDV